MDNTRLVGPTRDLFYLYRPTVPSVRAQAIQAVHMAHALAGAGVRVTLWAEPSEPTTPGQVLAFYGLAPLPTLHLGLLPQARTPAAVLFRARFVAWLAKAHHPVVFARSMRYAHQALTYLGGRFTLVLDVHELESLAEPKHRAGQTITHLREQHVVARADGVVTNAPGTLRVLSQVHTLRCPARAIHNGTHPSRVRTPRYPGVGAGYLGSLRTFKGLETLARAAALCHTPVTLVGAVPGDPLAKRLCRLSKGRLCLEPPLPYHKVPDRLAAFAVLVVPLAGNRFGRSLTSPLKLWDALATSRPVVAAKLPAIQRAAPGATLPYTPGDAHSLAKAIDRATTQPPRRPLVRTWADRAREVLAFVETLP